MILISNKVETCFNLWLRIKESESQRNVREHLYYLNGLYLDDLGKQIRNRMAENQWDIIFDL